MIRFTKVRTAYLLLALVCCAFPSLLRAKPLRVGVILPLTGAVSDTGTSMAHAIRLADQIHDTEGLVDFIFEDGQYLGSSSVSAFQKLKTIDKVQAIIIFGGPPSAAISPIVESGRVPTIALTGTTTLRKERGWLTLMWESGPKIGATFAEMLKESPSSAVALVTLNSEVLMSIAESYRATTVNPIIVDEQLNPGEHDLLSIAAKIRNRNPEYVIVNLIGAQGSELVKKLRGLGYKGQFVLHTGIFADPQFREPYPALYEGAWVATFNDSTAETMYRQYREVYKQEPSRFGTGTAYDGATSLIGAVKQGWRGDIPFPAAEIEGTMGRYIRTQAGNLEPPAGVKQVKNGKLVCVRCDY